MKGERVYDYFDPPEGPVLITEGKGEGAKQEFKDECDINFIMERARQGAEVILPFVVDGRAGQYMDLSSAPEDFLQAQLIVRDAEERFAGLPVKIRNRFENDPEQLLLFLADEANRTEAEDLGLIEKPAPPAVEAPPIVVP